MGLDMYLTAKKYLSEYNEEGKPQRDAVAALFPEMAGAKLQYVQFEVGYWRKANAIHKWFVTNVQNGVDECQTSYVPRDRLIALREVCVQVLDDKKQARTLLPTAEGFFFGQTTYDNWYFQNVEDTIEIIDRALALPKHDWIIEYHASW